MVDLGVNIINSKSMITKILQSGKLNGVSEEAYREVLKDLEKCDLALRPIFYAIVFSNFGYDVNEDNYYVKEED